ncbi:MAG: diguanylate cyclase [Spirochaetes bacterium]|nr:diguanylate cyclase [Spirochaetota bacterium]
MNSIGRKKIRQLYYVSSITILIIMALSLSITYYTNLYREYKQKIEQLKQGIIDQKKNYAKSVIIEKISDIEHDEETVRSKYAFAADTICNSVYITVESGRFAVSSAEPYLKSVHIKPFNVVIISRKKNKILSAALNRSDVFKNRSAGPVENFIKTAPLYSFRKISDQVYVYVFIDQQDFDEMLKLRAMDIVRAAKLLDDGYIWINYILSYNGGKGYAVRLVHPNMPETEGSLLSTDMQDIKGSFPYKMELDGINSQGEIFFDYYFKKMNSDVISHKMTYARLYKKFDWIIATGVYLDDVDKLIDQERVRMDTSFRYVLRNNIIIVILVFIISIIALISFEKRISTLIEDLTDRLEKSNLQLTVEKKNVEKAYQKIRKVAYLDPLTGLWNRRAMYKRLSEENSKKTRTGKNFCIIMCDIDRFKKINDIYGHKTGDDILKHLASILISNMRAEDNISRWGGEEFLILVSSSTLKQAAAIAEKLRSIVAEEKFKSDGKSIPVTMTFGVAQSGKKDHLDDIINAADDRMYSGKKKSRNCVVS